VNHGLLLQELSHTDLIILLQFTAQRILISLQIN